MDFEYGNAISANTMANNYVDEGSSKRCFISFVPIVSFILFFAVYILCIGVIYDERYTRSASIDDKM